MKKSELIARYDHFGQDLIVVPTKEFMDIYKSNNVEPSKIKTFGTAGGFKFHVDGWDYYNYSDCFPIGTDGNHDCDAFQFRIRVATESDKLAVKKFFSKENGSSEFDESNHNVNI